ncbi:MAG: replication-associated recombination protein A [Lachnospiraceae bacterium]|nr:replication-associated recombination protein A [Lachnospiraceae bacterium]
MDLFDYMRSSTMEKESPLASRMRPRTLDEVMGQRHIIGRDKLLYRAIQADKLGSVIFYGPPGTGKTTLARVIANTTSARFEQLNATAAGKKDMEETIKSAKDMLGMYGQKTILFIDEIHRFNKGQQDYLLPFVEDGTVTLIGATTENPYFEVNNALLSRSRIFELKPLEPEDVKALILRAVCDTERGMGSYGAEITDEAADFLAHAAGGDARAALNAVELGILTTEKSADGRIRLTLAVASECIQKRVIRYDKDGDNHYDTVSAFIKSMRGSDPDAALYYLARMLNAGEDVRFISRRIMICAAEDVGNADPNALTVAVSAAQAVERIGMPEGQIPLAQAVAYVACAPKSNAASQGIFKAMEAVQGKKNPPVPVHLQDSHYKGAGKLGHGKGYLYTHDFPNHYVKQQYLPDGLENERFYFPTEIGCERAVKERMERLREETGSVDSDPF